MTEPSWDDLNRTKAPAPQDNRFDDICSRVFTTAAGKELLAELRKRHFDNGGNPLADERALRVRAAQQHFVREFETACERGLAANVKRTKA